MSRNSFAGDGPIFTRVMNGGRAARKIRRPGSVTSLPNG